MRITAPAKINLTLEVMSKREDGYHALRSVMVPLALCDELTIEPSSRFSFSCSDPALQSDDNLAVRAAHAVDPAAAIALVLTKRIPTQAGLGGGSSDAAAVLLGAMRGALTAPDSFDWVGAARSLGSDVAFFLTQTGALVEGTGERVTAGGVLPPWHVLAIKPPDAVSTAAAYRLLDERARPTRPRNSSDSIAALTALQRGDFAAVLSLLGNDFHEPIAAAIPGVARALDALAHAGAARALLAGSGSAVFALFQTRREMLDVNERLDLGVEFARFPTAFAHEEAWR